MIESREMLEKMQTYSDFILLCSKLEPINYYLFLILRDQIIFKVLAKTIKLHAKKPNLWTLYRA